MRHCVLWMSCIDLHSRRFLWGFEQSYYIDCKWYNVSCLTQHKHFKSEGGLLPSILDAREETHGRNAPHRLCAQQEKCPMENDRQGSLKEKCHVGEHVQWCSWIIYKIYGVDETKPKLCLFFVKKLWIADLWIQLIFSLSKLQTNSSNIMFYIPYSQNITRLLEWKFVKSKKKIAISLWSSWTNQQGNLSKWHIPSKYLVQLHGLKTLKDTQVPFKDINCTTCSVGSIRTPSLQINQKCTFCTNGG